MDNSSKIASYISQHETYSSMLAVLRSIIKKHPFEETLKWGMPTYVYGKRNLVGLGALKNHVAVWFFQGALLSDKMNLLHNAQEGKTKAMRQLHFKSADDIDEKALSNFLEETIKNQEKGIYVPVSKKVGEVLLPPELKACLGDDPLLKSQFLKLSPGRQKEYAVHISSAKRALTKSQRLKKIDPLIKAGKGLNDKYKKS